MEPIDQLDDEHTNVLWSCHKEFSEALIVPVASVVSNRTEFGHTLNEKENFVSEILLDFKRSSIGILNGVVEKGSTNSPGSHAHVRKDRRNWDQVRDVGFARVSFVTLVRLLGKLVCS